MCPLRLFLVPPAEVHVDEADWVAPSHDAEIGLASAMDSEDMLGTERLMAVEVERMFARPAGERPIRA